MKNNVFFEIFVGEIVEIVTDLQVPSQVKLDEEGGAVEIKLPLTVQGYLMDMDNSFVYLSSDGVDTNQAIQIKDIKHIQIVNIDDVVEESEDDIPDPEEGSHFN